MLVITKHFHQRCHYPRLMCYNKILHVQIHAWYFQLKKIRKILNLIIFFRILTFEVIYYQRVQISKINTWEVYLASIYEGQILLKSYIVDNEHFTTTASWAGIIKRINTKFSPLFYTHTCWKKKLKKKCYMYPKTLYNRWVLY